MADSELQAVESALNTLVLAQSEKALQKVVNRLLPAILSALSTKSAAARAKCIETLQHINVRVRANTNIQLPFDAVLDVCTASTAAIMTINVGIQGGYLKRCFDRLTSAEQAATFKKLANTTPHVSSVANRDVLHLLSLRALTELSQVRSKARDDTSLLEGCTDFGVEGLLDYWLRALRFKLKTPVSDAALMAIVRASSQYAGVRRPDRAAKIFPHLLIATGMASRSSVASVGEDALKKVDTCEVLAESDPSLVQTLFALFMDPMTEIAQRIIILGKGLLIVPLCASCFPEVLEVIKLSLHTTGIPTRFQALGMQFVSFVVKHSELAVFEQHVAALIELMLQLIRNETNGSPSFPDAVRAFGFTAIGEIVTRLPSMMGQHSITPQLFFEAAQDPGYPHVVRASAAQSLIAVARVLSFDCDSPNNDAHRSVVDALVKTLENCSDAATTARAAAVHWANECFAYADCDARLLNIIAAADPKQDIRHIGRAGLSPKRWSFMDGTAPKKGFANGDSDISMAERLPQVTEIVDAFLNYKGPKPPPVIEAFLSFSFYLIRNEIVTRGQLDVANIEDVDTFFGNHPPVKDALIKITQLADDVVFERINGRTPTLEKAGLAISLFSSKVSSLSSESAERYAPYIDQLVALAIRKSASGDVVVARAIASLVGSASNALSVEKVHALVSKLAENLEPNASGSASGRDGEDERAAYTLCLGQIIVACRRRPELELNVTEYSPENPLCNGVMHMTRRVLLAVEGSDVVRIATCLSIMDIGAVGTLPISMSSREILIGSLTGILKLHSTSQKLAQAAANTVGRICIGEPRHSFKKKAIDILLHLCKDRKEDDIRFVAAESLVRCASGFDAPSPIALEQASDSKQDAPDETVAEALQGVLHMRTDPFEVKNVLQECVDSDEVADSGLESAVKGAIKLGYDERPTARAGGCICLVTFLRLLGRADDKDEANKIGEFKMTFRTESDEERFKQQQKCLVDQLERIQRAFTVLLGDRSEFVQQLSSCGVALAYQMCPPNQQSDLVSALVRSLTAGKAKSAATVPGDQGTLLELGNTDVKEEKGNAPKSATYKELCTLAQDMGQPELVYKFMDLAGHAALWNNRKGAALAGSALLGGDLAAEQLKPHVKSLLPRLYVYCYDPTESVRIAMGSVLSAVIKAGGLGSVYEAVTTHFNIVIDFCIKSMTAQQWRSREAGFGALRDALASRTWEQVHDYLKEFWYLTQRGMDDIKESVRKAAAGTARALSELSIHMCDPGQVGVDIAQEASHIVIPAVMPGILHADDTIRGMCGNVMSKLIRHGGEALRPSVPDLVSSLLEAATEIDSQALNYVQYHVSDPNALEDARVNAASSMAASPLVDSLERLVGLIDESNVEDTVRSMTRLAKIGVGIPTRAGTARFFSTVLKARATVVAPLAAKLMSAAFSASAMEHNATLRTAWCNAAGTATKLCQPHEVSRFVDRIIELASSEEERDRTQASFVALGLWHESPDTARSYASALLPIAYMGCHETEHVDALEQGQPQSEDSSSSTTAQLNWARVWDEGAPNPKAALRLYAKEITDMCEKRLSTSGQYRVKRGAARAIGAVAEAWSKDSADSLTTLIQRGVQALFKSVPGHIWDGKIVVLQSIGIIASQCGEVPTIWGDKTGLIALIRLLFTESKRGKREYRIAAIDSIGKVLSGFRNWPASTNGTSDPGQSIEDGNVDLFDELYKHLEEHWIDFSSIEIKQKAEDQSPSPGGEAATKVDVDVKRVVWETGSDANAVDARNKARKAKRLLCVATIRCLECGFGCMPNMAKGDSAGNQNDIRLAQLIRIVGVLYRVVQSDWEVRMATISSLEKCIKRFNWANCDTNIDDVHQKILAIFDYGLQDSKYAAVRKKTSECINAFLQCGGQQHKQLVTEHPAISEMVAKSSREDNDHAAQLEAQKLQAILH